MRAALLHCLCKILSDLNIVMSHVVQGADTWSYCSTWAKHPVFYVFSSTCVQKTPSKSNLSRDCITWVIFHLSDHVLHSNIIVSLRPVSYVTCNTVICFFLKFARLAVALMAWCVLYRCLPVLVQLRYTAGNRWQDLPLPLRKDVNRNTRYVCSRRRRTVIQ